MGPDVMHDVGWYRRGFIALLMLSGSVYQGSPHVDDGRVRCAKVLVPAVGDRLHALRYSLVLGIDAGDASVADLFLHLSVDKEVVPLAS